MAPKRKYPKRQSYMSWYTDRILEQWDREIEAARKIEEHKKKTERDLLLIKKRQKARKLYEMHGDPGDEQLMYRMNNPGYYPHGAPIEIGTDWGNRLVHDKRLEKREQARERLKTRSSPIYKLKINK